jgi:hypothetical protein
VQLSGFTKGDRVSVREEENGRWSMTGTILGFAGNADDPKMTPLWFVRIDGGMERAVVSSKLLKKLEDAGEGP